MRPPTLTGVKGPRSWLTWFGHLLHTEVPKNPGETWGLYRNRLDATDSPEERETWWTIRTHADAETAAFGMVQELEVEGLPTLFPLLERDKLLTAGEMMGPVDRVRAEDHHNYD